MQWWQTTRGLAAQLPALEEGAGEPREAVRGQRHGRDRAREEWCEVAECAEESWEQNSGGKMPGRTGRGTDRVGLRPREAERERESGEDLVEETSSSQESPEASRESQKRPSDSVLKLRNSNRDHYRAESRFSGRRAVRAAEAEREDDQGGNCVEESQEIAESPEAGEESQIETGEGGLKSEVNNPPSIEVKRGARSTGARAREQRVTQLGLRERGRAGGGREWQADRQYAPAQVAGEEERDTRSEGRLDPRPRLQINSESEDVVGTPHNKGGESEAEKATPEGGTEEKRTPIPGGPNKKTYNYREGINKINQKKKGEE